MTKNKLRDILSERVKNFAVMMREGATIGDKATIFQYHLKAPLQFTNYLRGIKNSRTLSKDVFIKNNFGLFFCGRNFSSVFGALSNCEPEIRKEFFLEKGTALDIGANLGMFCIPLAKKLSGRGKVVAIEAEKNNIALLEKNIKINHVKNITVIPKGAYFKKGKVNLNIDDFGTGGHSIQKKDFSKKGVKNLIDVDTIDNVVKDLGIKKIDIIKIDIEGGELDAFKGAKKTLKRDHPKIIFEAVENIDLKKIEKALSQYGYKFRKIGEWNYVAELPK